MLLEVGRKFEIRRQRALSTDPKVGRQALSPSGEGGVSGGGGLDLLEQQQGCQRGWRDV